MADTESIADGSWLTPPHSVTPTGIAATATRYLPEHHWQLHRASELNALNDIIRTIAVTSDLSRMYDQLYRKLSDLLDVDALLILLAGEPPAGARQTACLQRSPIFPAIGLPVEDVDPVVVLGGQQRHLLVVVEVRADQ